MTFANTQTHIEIIHNWRQDVYYFKMLEKRCYPLEQISWKHDSFTYIESKNN